MGDDEHPYMEMQRQLLEAQERVFKLFWDASQVTEEDFKRFKEEEEKSK